MATVTIGADVVIIIIISIAHKMYTMNNKMQLTLNWTVRLIKGTDSGSWKNRQNKTSCKVTITTSFKQTYTENIHPVVMSSMLL